MNDPRLLPFTVPDGMTVFRVPSRSDRVLAWVVVLLVTSVAASVAVACLCGAAVAVRLAADFLTH